MSEQFAPFVPIGGQDSPDKARLQDAQPVLAPIAREGLQDCMRTAMAWTLLTASVLCGTLLVRTLAAPSDLKTVAVQALYLVAFCTGGVATLAVLAGIWIGIGDILRSS
jgi:Na+-driven multidrug efflux pump